jgi:hypothetical protein
LDVRYRIKVIIVISIVRIRLDYQMKRKVDRIVTVKINILNIGNGGVRSEINPRNSLYDVVEIKTRDTAGKRKRNKKLTLTLNIILYCKNTLNLC